MTQAISVDQSRLMDRLMYWSELHKADEFQALLYAAADASLNLHDALEAADKVLLKKLKINTNLQGDY